MPAFSLGAVPVGDYLVFGVLITVFLLAGAAWLVAVLVRDDRADPDREHYADE